MWFFDPEIDFDALKGVMEKLRSGGNWRDASRWFTDLSLVQQINLDFDQILAFSKFKKALLNPMVHVRSAFLTSTTLTFGMVRMYEGLMADANITIKSFSNRIDCAAFLNIPVSVILPEISAETSA